MSKTMALILLLVSAQAFAQGYGDRFSGDLSRIGDCLDICREYKQCVQDGDSARAQALFVEFWQRCSADPDNGLPDLIWIGGSPLCPSPQSNPALYVNVVC